MTGADQAFLAKTMKGAYGTLNNVPPAPPAPSLTHTH